MTILGLIRPVMDQPLTIVNDVAGYDGGIPQGDARWFSTTIGNLYLDNKVWVADLYTTLDYAYRVLDAWWIEEDTTVARLRLYDDLGNYHGPGYFTGNGHPLIDGQMVTTSGNGQVVKVESSLWPSEEIHFGMYDKHPNHKHTTLCVCFGLYPEPRYRQQKATIT